MRVNVTRSAYDTEILKKFQINHPSEKTMCFSPTTTKPYEPNKNFCANQIAHSRSESARNRAYLIVFNSKEDLRQVMSKVPYRHLNEEN
jgi:hypothetical protein